MSVVSGEREAFRLTRTGAEWGNADLDALRNTFTRQHCVKLPGFIEPALLHHIHRLVSNAEFAEFAHDDIASELLMAAGVCTGVLDFLVNDPRLFAFVREATGCLPIRAFVGRVYRRYPGTHHHDSWHDDLGRQRMVGMSVNLSADQYEGGTFEIRRFNTDTVIAALPNIGYGDAILFRIGEGFEHQVTALRGSFPKTAFAGWFVGHRPGGPADSAPAAQ
jgi:2-oxoglutarate-Fe(II)-dependent oxygenase superfamily protein